MMSRSFVVRAALGVCLGVFLANCAGEPGRRQPQLTAQQQREIGAFSNKAKYGSASPRVVHYGETVPKGGGRDHVGKPYRVAGRWYTPRENPNYSAVGQASWYGAAFHGRKTANGEVYDKYALSAAHPTMPLPSYARVTNLSNGHSVVVRVNDRGPFHGNRIIDLSQRTADALQFRHLGTARVRVDYLRRASTAGSDDRMLLATLRTDGQPAQLPGGATPLPGQPPIMVASAEPFAPAVRAPAVRAEPTAVVEVQRAAPAAQGSAEPSLRVAEVRQVRRDVPLPPERPFDLGAIPGAATPMQRVNNGEAARPAPAAAERRQQRVAAVYFAPATGFASALGGADPMAKLRPGRFALVAHQPVAQPR